MARQNNALLKEHEVSAAQLWVQLGVVVGLLLTMSTNDSRGLQTSIVSNLKEHPPTALDGPAVGSSAAVNWSKSVKDYNEGSTKREREKEVS